MAFEISNGQNNGTLELGTNNREGRVAWSQIYYLNVFIDVISIDGRWKLSTELHDLVEQLVERTEIEFSLLDRVVATDGFQSWCFTVDRSPALSRCRPRVLALYSRFREEVAGAPRLPAVERVGLSSATLEDHEEVLETEVMPGWTSPGQAYLMWPRGSQFPYDGLNVPFNHQNEWALGVLRTQSDGDAANRRMLCFTSSTTKCSHRMEVASRTTVSGRTGGASHGMDGPQRS